MASVALSDAWISLASDLTQSVTMELTGENDQTRRPVETRRYAGGRVRAISRPGVKKQLGLNFEMANRSEFHTLEDWIGKTVLYRDPLGRRLWGVYGEVSGAEIPGAATDALNVNLTLSEVTYSEAV